ncbi:hypothetical protein V2A60_008575 [Cordyceps javanica]
MTRITFAIASSMLLAQAAHAATLSLSGNECPQGWSFNQLGGEDKSYCCYGSSTIINKDGYCCVHSNVNIVSGAGSGGSGGGGNIVGGDLTDSCFPFCSTTKSHEAKRAIPTQQCIDKVPFSASDYSERVSAASKSAAASQTGGSQPSSNSASATKTDSGASSTAAAGSGSGSGGGSSSSSSGSAATPTKNAAPAITHGAVGGIVAAAVLLAV